MKNKITKKTIRVSIFIVVFLFFFMFSSAAVSAEPKLPIPKIGLSLEEANSPREVANSIEILFILTILALAPSILLMMTCFTRMIIVLSFIRKAISTQTTPPNQVLIGLALFLTFFIMAPIGAEINNKAIQPYLAGEIDQEVALVRAMEPMRAFMFKHTREKDLALFIDISGSQKPHRLGDVPTKALIPAFMISELKTGFQIGFVLFIPFIVIDMVVASTLMSMGMMMLPPVMISLPFKILLFIMVDGWNLIIKSLIMGFQ
ncbi:flagellar type III secretion system pore protein FliP [Thermotalea metallivorans]|uniref:Flagellar biosynthetic protein FliP n=1 Tax=Thermotalea metallivorans TaxID=520762 RepID=A0A140L5D6_9FIRM|nr:flagellar type III secretion system pore protein FliP [Thermotalea metallivorans]KXG75761.1 Flagellar biosynthetic protein FliP [Thermotalea metallivorans]